MSNELKKITKVLFEAKQVVLMDQFFQNLNTDSLGKNSKEALTLMLKCEQLGFSFETKMINVVSHASKQEMKDFWDWFKPLANKIYKGSKYEPMYPNFPEQVIEASDYELCMNALIHYAGDALGIRLLPEYQKDKRKKLKENVEPMQMKFGVVADLPNMLKNYLEANTSLSEQSKEIVTKLFKYLETENKEQLNSLVKEANIAQKETLAFMGKEVINSSLNFNECMVDKFKTPTDLLRLSAALNDGDVSLVLDTKVKGMSRAMRKAFLGKLESLLTEKDSTQFEENMFTYREQWVKLAHAMHVGEFKNKVPKTYEVIQKLRENNKEHTFTFNVQKALDANDMEKTVNLLKTRPGVFGRMLGKVVSSAKDTNLVINEFGNVSKDISTPVLLQIHAKYKYDNQDNKKIILPKGGIGKSFVKKEGNIIKLKDEDAAKIVKTVENTLLNRFSQGESLGNVYIDENLKLQNVPFAQRVASKALKTVPKGSRFNKEEEDKNIIRFFIWWNQKSEVNDYAKRVDIDLSIAVYDKDYNLLKQCAYYALDSGYMTHSGDITSAPNGAAEYIDVNIKGLVKDVPGAAFVAPVINSFTGQSYCDVPECYAGWMEREHLQKGEIFEPSTVKNKVDIASNQKQVMLVIYDIENKQYIWADQPIKNVGVYNNLAGNKSSVAYAIEAIVEMKKPNLYDLFEMHANARGKIVNDINKADTVFSIKEGITPYDFEVIAAKFMADEFQKEEKNNKLKVK